ncbi:MAG: CYTH domain-containing protein [Rhodomicrobium sp.]|nr:CYTH domain-containing protein [Rhodomicrobium sp.]
MAIEIERRFLVKSSAWQRSASPPHRIKQAYLTINDAVSVRVRLVDGGNAFLTIKSAASGIERAEFDYPIPRADAGQLIAFRTGALIEKLRYGLAMDRARWEIDVFEGELAGLVIAEIELDSKDRHIDRPHWLGEEITEDSRYANASLARYGLPG